MEEYTAAVILNHNDNENTLRLAQTFNAMPFVGRLVVADNSASGGLEGTETALGHPKDIFLKIENNGYAAGNNEAVRYLERECGLPAFIMISNPDVEVSEEAVKACVDFLQAHDDFAVAAPHMHRPDGKPHHLAGWRERGMLCDIAYSSGLLSRTVGMYRETYPQEHWNTPFSAVDCVSGAFFAVKGKAFKDAGFFDEKTFLFYEEDILGFRLKRLGYREAVLNDYTFIHREGVSAGRHIRYIRKYLAMQKSRIYFHRVYKKEPFYKMAALYAATGLGLAENALKTVLHAVIRRKRDEE